MAFHIGDKVVHWSYGPGEIVRIDDKSLSGHSDQYYVVRVRDLTLYVPVAGAEKHRLRPPTARGEYEKLFEILRAPGEYLSDDRFERKTQLMELLSDGRLESVCRAIRYLYDFGCRKKLNDYDAALLERARRFLLEEWMLSLGIPLGDAQRKLDRLLEDGRLKNVS